MKYVAFVILNDLTQAIVIMYAECNCDSSNTHLYDKNKENAKNKTAISRTN